MRQKPFTAVLAAGALLITAGAARAGDQIVTDCSSDAPLRSAWTALQQSAGGTLTFACGTTTIVLTGGELVADTADAVVDGGGVITVSGAGATRLFRVTGGRTLTLKNIALTMGFASVGGCIATRGNLILDRAQLSLCSATNDGGAIWNDGSVTVVSTTFDANRALTGDGGAICNTEQVNVGTLTVSDSLFVGNNAQRDGGAVANTFFTQGYPSATLVRTRLQQNISGRNGGGLSSYHGHVEVAASTLDGNQSVKGGGIWNAGFGLIGHGGSIRLTNVTLSGNQASSNGGGIYNSGQAALIDVTLEGNTGAHGGAIAQVPVSIGDWLTVENVIAADSPAGGNCYVSTGPPLHGIESRGSNLSTDNSCAPYFVDSSDVNAAAANLGALKDNGGPTPTHKPFSPSVVIDHGHCVPGIVQDQRGVTRPLGATCDIGAVEYEGFTDDPLMPGATVVKAVHVTELRSRIDLLRARSGVGPFEWTDPNLAGGTPVRAQHMLDLRVALDAAYAAAGLALPTYTGPAPAPGTPILASQLEQVRANVLYLEQR